MTIHRLSAGAGYRYLMRTTASGDTPRSAEQSLTAYYTQSGTPPGRWHGTGLAGLADGHGVAAGTVVDDAGMAALFGTGHDPATGQPLGRPFPAYTTAADRISHRVDRLPGSLTREQRDTLTEQITAEETARPVRAAVAGFDLTFTVPKSVSVLWALADPGVQAQIAAAHHAAVADTLTHLESTALFTRVGARSCAQVTTRGAVAAGFDHVDTRTGDPNLHTHLVLANKVQGPDGAWRSVDSRALFTAAVALSETYDSLLADHLTTRLGLVWQWRDRGANRSPAYEITGVDDDLLAVFSTRSAAITARVAELVGEHVAATGRHPTRAQMLRMRQQATLDTRPAKTPSSLAEQMTVWRQRAVQLGHSPTDVTRRALIPGTGQGAAGSAVALARVLATGAIPTAVTVPVPAAGLDDTAVADLAGEVLAGLIQRRSTWTRWNTLAETARATRHLRFTTTAERLAVHDRVVAAALAVCTRVDPAEQYTVPAEYRRPDGASVFTRAGTTRYTHPLVLAAERHLLDAHADTTAPTVTPPSTDPDHALRHRADPVAGQAAPSPGRVVLAEDQARAVHAACTSGRRLDVLVGPAGSGKTTTLRALRRVWEYERGPGSVIGLAPSATAARELARSLRVPCENTAKWLHETHPATSPRGGTWRLRPGQLVIVDEASLAATATLDALTDQAVAADAKLLLVGDHHQLGPIDAGGAFALLADDGQPIRLESLWRYVHPWEAHATLRLRAGDPDILDAYDAHGRLHDGPHEAMLEAAYQAWIRDIDTGATSVLLAADRATVAALNHRARTDRVTAAAVAADGVTTRDGTTLGVGDRVVTRRNDRRLALPGGEHVRNGMLWNVTATHPDGSLTIASVDAPTSARGVGSGRLVLPAEYVRRHVDLGYALTVHRAQGLTVDTTHLVTTPATTRETLYVGLTRGRRANHAYTATDAPPGDTHPTGPADHSTGREVLTGILAATGTEPAATTAVRTAAAETVAPDRLRNVAATLTADIVRRRWTRLLTRHLDPGLAQRLNRDPAAGTLHAALARAETAGHPPNEILDHIGEAVARAAGPMTPAADDVWDGDTVRRPARAVDAWSDATTPPGPIDPRDALRHRPVTDPGDPAAPVLDDIQRLVDAHLAEALAWNRHPAPPDTDAVEPGPTHVGAPAAPRVEGPSR